MKNAMTVTGKAVLGALTKQNENKQWSQWLAVTSANLCLFTAGICFAWSSPSLAILQRPDGPFTITNSDASWIASLLPFGSALGPILGAICTKWFGPKQAILTSSIPFLLGFVLIIFADSASYLFVSRFISGIGVGFGFSSVPVYISEVAENSNRGALMILFTIMLSLGGMITTCIGPYISIQLLASLACVFPVLLLASFAYMPDSPYYLMRIGKEDEAKKALKWLRRQQDDDAIFDEANEIRKSVEGNASLIEGIKEIGSQPNPKALLIVFLTILAQQSSGVLAVAFYQEQIYASSGIPIDPGLAVIISQIIGAFFGVAMIFFIDRWGRKPLLILSSVGCAISSAMIGVYFQYEDFSKWFPIIGLNLMMVAFSIGLGPIPYTILSEVFPSNVKEVAICIISVSGAVLGFGVTKLFQIINDELGTSVVFYCLSVVTVILLIINYIILPETMNKSLLDIQNILMRKNSSKCESKEITCKV